jgi:hypothetical protein
MNIHGPYITQFSLGSWEIEDILPLTPAFISENSYFLFSDAFHDFVYCCWYLVYAQIIYHHVSLLMLMSYPWWLNPQKSDRYLK